MTDPAVSRRISTADTGARPRSQRFLRCRALFLLATGLGLLPAGASGQNSAPPPTLQSIVPRPALLTNERHPLPGTLAGGALVGESAARGFEALAKAGVRTYVDLRSEAEVSPETAALAAAAGLDYRHLPIAGEADLDLASARALDLLLDDWGRYPVALACSSGNRVGALLALRAFWLDGVDATAALELGLAAGLTRLEPSVRQLLGLPPLPPLPAVTVPPAPAAVPAPAANSAAKPAPDPS